MTYFNLITSQRPHPYISSHWELGCQHVIVGSKTLFSPQQVPWHRGISFICQQAKKAFSSRNVWMVPCACQCKQAHFPQSYPEATDELEIHVRTSPKVKGRWLLIPPEIFTPDHGGGGAGGDLIPQARDAKCYQNAKSLPHLFTFMKLKGELWWHGFNWCIDCRFYGSNCVEFIKQWFKWQKHT